MNDVTILLLGATGDLARRKLLPALYSLWREKKIEKCLIIGAAREKDATVASIAEATRPYIQRGFDDTAWREFVGTLVYQSVDFSVAEDFTELAHTIDTLEAERGLLGNRLVYVASASTFYCGITEKLSASGLVARKNEDAQTWHRIIYEKPFGWDLPSAHAINACIAQHFNEEQIYRIDHYLTKELASNIALIRFSNCVLEPLWNNRYIDQVQIVLSEKLGIQNRGLYYDEYGALRDVVQNHLYELLALVCMEAPEKLEGDYICEQRAQVLKKVRFIDGILGQYVGYLNEQYVKQDSKTETFAALELMVDNPRWTGVPFFLKTGKNLGKHETMIHIKFKQVDCLLTKQCPSDANYLTIQLSPEERFTLTLNVRRPGLEQELVPMHMEYCHSCNFALITPTPHEALIDEVIKGEQSVSVRFDEIESAWKSIDSIYAQHLPLYTYEPGSTGPKELEDFSNKHGMRWRS
jgi:glucose-6-phosphate 1-dehydrogenase